MRGIGGLQYDVFPQRVTLDASGNGVATVTYREPFVQTPHATVVPHKGDDGTLAISAETKTGFTLTITGSRIRAAAGVDADFIVIAHEMS